MMGRVERRRKAAVLCCTLLCVAALLGSEHQLSVQYGHTNTVNSVRFSPDGAYALSGGGKDGDRGDSFSDEALRTLLTETENNRNSLCVVLAG